MDEPGIEIGLERDGTGRRPPPGWPSRILEGAGLVAVLFGFAAWQPLWLALGIAAIALSYSLYRRKHGRGGPGGPPDGGGADGFDGGGDGGGGD